MPDIIVIEALPVKLENGNRVVLENGNIVVAPPSVRVSESVSVQIEAVSALVNVSDSNSVSETVALGISESALNISDSIGTAESVNVSVYSPLPDQEISVAESYRVLLENGNRVVLENGDVVVTAFGIIVSERISVAVSALPTTARVYGPAIQMMG